MKSEDIPFVGGPLDGRALPVMATTTGKPPKVYSVPVPDAEGGPDTVLVYVRESVPGTRAVQFTRWRYVFAPDGKPERTVKWPWSKRSKPQG
ncbi:hypothetical protein AB0J38_12790 [Streptomyces sp. NPDC050095]|uniref:hypothetical protein n=1 Tax=unclassified Streptomyces TaxID=2593676 RepID=UPI0034306AD9